MYGPLTVKVENGKLSVRFYPSYVGEANHWQFDTFQVRWNDRSLDKDMLTFVLGSDGKVTEVRWQGFTTFKNTK
jgi:hypothetical protein